ncbi:MAG: hypothetical protein ACE37H_12035 [Phycisphaeraceae bacterium]
MEPIYVHSSQYQQDDNDPSIVNAYTLTLSQTLLPDRADEIASVVARSPLDRLEHAFHFDNGDEYLAWTVATDAQRKATHLGYNPIEAGIEAFVIGPASQAYGRLDDYFASQPPMTDSRLVVYKQNLKAGSTDITEHLGPKHQDRFVGGASLEQSAQSAGRALLSDLVKAYEKQQPHTALEETHHPFAHSYGFRQRGHPKSSSQIRTGLGTLELDQLAKVKLPADYARDDFYQDAKAVKLMTEDLSTKAFAEAQRQDYDNASQAYCFAAELQSLYRHLCHGRHAEALRAMNTISPYILDDLPHRLYEHLETQTKSSVETSWDKGLESIVTPAQPISPLARPDLRYRRVDLEGLPKHYATMKRLQVDAPITVRVHTPDISRSMRVQGGVDARDQQYGAACWVYDHIAAADADGQLINEYYDAIIRLAD